MTRERWREARREGASACMLRGGDSGRRAELVQEAERREEEEKARARAHRWQEEREKTRLCVPEGVRRRLGLCPTHEAMYDAMDPALHARELASGAARSVTVVQFRFDDIVAAQPPAAAAAAAARAAAAAAAPTPPCSRTARTKARVARREAAAEGPPRPQSARERRRERAFAGVTAERAAAPRPARLAPPGDGPGPAPHRPLSRMGARVAAGSGPAPDLSRGGRGPSAAAPLWRQPGPQSYYELGYFATRFPARSTAAARVRPCPPARQRPASASAAADLPGPGAYSPASPSSRPASPGPRWELQSGRPAPAVPERASEAELVELTRPLAESGATGGPAFSFGHAPRPVVPPPAPPPPSGQRRRRPRPASAPARSWAERRQERTRAVAARRAGLAAAEEERRRQLLCRDDERRRRRAEREEAARTDAARRTWLAAVCGVAALQEMASRVRVLRTTSLLRSSASRTAASVRRAAAAWLRLARNARRDRAARVIQRGARRRAQAHACARRRAAAALIGRVLADQRDRSAVRSAIALFRVRVERIQRFWRGAARVAKARRAWVLRLWDALAERHAGELAELWAGLAPADEVARALAGCRASKKRGKRRRSGGKAAAAAAAARAAALWAAARPSPEARDRAVAAGMAEARREYRRAYWASRAGAGGGPAPSFRRDSVAPSRVLEWIRAAVSSAAAQFTPRA